MATVINHPAGETDSGMGFFLGALLIILFVFLFWFFGMPLMRQGGTVPQPAPQQQPGAPVINVPDKVDVNLNQGQ